MEVYVFGNEYVAEDRRAIEIARELEGTVGGVSFVLCWSLPLVWCGDRSVAMWSCRRTYRMLSPQATPGGGILHPRYDLFKDSG